MSSKVRANEGSVEQRCVMITAGDEGDEFGTSYLVMMNILLVQEQEESREKWMDELMGRQVNCASNSIWQAATGKRARDEWRRGRAYFTVSGLK